MSAEELTNAVLIEDWKILPVKGGEICLSGQKNGEAWITTPITGCRSEAGKKYLKTKSGTVYQLGTQHGSLWALGLQIKRPEKYARLLERGIL